MEENMNLMDLYHAIENGISYARIQGYKLIRGTWGDMTINQVCPLSSLDRNINSSQQAAKHLNVSVDWIESFLEGYDGYRFIPLKIKEAYDCGAYFRKKYNPPKYYDVICNDDDL